MGEGGGEGDPGSTPLPMLEVHVPGWGAHMCRDQTLKQGFVVALLKLQD